MDKALIDKVEDVNKDLHAAIGADNAARKLEAFKTYVDGRTNPDITIRVSGQEMCVMPFELWYSDTFTKLKELITEISETARTKADELKDELDGRITE